MSLFDLSLTQTLLIAWVVQFLLVVARPLASDGSDSGVITLVTSRRRPGWFHLSGDLQAAALFVTTLALVVCWVAG